MADLSAFPITRRWPPSHPDRLKTRGVDATTGSLGQGISIAGGMALFGLYDVGKGPDRAELFDHGGIGRLRLPLVFERIEEDVCQL